MPGGFWLDAGLNDSQHSEIWAAPQPATAGTPTGAQQAFYQTTDLPLGAALPTLRDRLLLNTLFEDAAEGVMAFIEKRLPKWKGC